MYFGNGRFPAGLILSLDPVEFINRDGRQGNFASRGSRYGFFESLVLYLIDSKRIIALFLLSILYIYTIYIVLLPCKKTTFVSPNRPRPGRDWCCRYTQVTWVLGQDL